VMNFKIKLLFTVLAVLIYHNVFAQPSHVSTLGNVANVFPYSTTSSNKTQVIYSPGDFTPSLLGTPVVLNTIFIYANSNASNVTYTNFSISIGNTPLTVFPNTTWATGLTQVYFAASQNFPTITQGQWLEF